MTALKAAVTQTLRGRTVSGLLERLGIEPRRYWILVELFHTLSERRDTIQHLGPKQAHNQMANGRFPAIKLEA